MRIEPSHAVIRNRTTRQASGERTTREPYPDPRRQSDSCGEKRVCTAEGSCLAERCKRQPACGEFAGMKRIDARRARGLDGRDRPTSKRAEGDSRTPTGRNSSRCAAGGPLSRPAFAAPTAKLRRASRSAQGLVGERTRARCRPREPGATASVCSRAVLGDGATDSGRWPSGARPVLSRKNQVLSHDLTPRVDSHRRAFVGLSAAGVRFTQRPGARLQLHFLCLEALGVTGQAAPPVVVQFGLKQVTQLFTCSSGRPPKENKVLVTGGAEPPKP